MRGIVDFDTHYYETRDCFTRHIEPKHRHLAVRPVRGDDGVERLVIGDEPFTYVRPRFEEVVAPGSMSTVLRDRSKSTFDDALSASEMRPEFQQRDARLEAMDAHGVDAAVLMPTLGSTVEHPMRLDPTRTYANLRAFNRWLRDEWGFADARIVAPPLLSLVDVDLAVAELEWALGEGARVIHLRPTPVNGRSIADPIFDPFWARVDEAAAVVAFHITDSGYNELYSVHWGERPNPPAHAQSALQWTCFVGDRPIMDTMAALVLHNLFGRFPRVRVASVEHGSMWVRYLLERMDRMKGMGRYGEWPGGRPEGKPSEIFRRHVWVVPFPDDDIGGLVEDIGVSQVLFGSDFPHPEGAASLSDLPVAVTALDRDVQRAILRENALRLLGRSEDALPRPPASDRIQ